MHLTIKNILQYSFIHSLKEILQNKVYKVLDFIKKAWEE